jgi:hypothetical protein
VSNRRKVRGRDWAPLSRQIRALPADRMRAQIDAIAPGFRDQFDAATADSSRFHARTRRVLVGTPGSYSEADPRDVPAPVLDQVTGLYLRVMTEVASGEREHCGHISLQAPRPAIACVFAHWICCYPCAPRYVTRPRLSEREEHTCDLCGTYLDGLYAQIGPVMLMIGICGPCKQRIGSQP